MIIFGNFFTSFLVYLVTLFPLYYKADGFSFGSLNFSSTSLQIPIDITIKITTTRALYEYEAIIIHMPGFTRLIPGGAPTNAIEIAGNIAFGQLTIAPSIGWLGEFIEGTNLGNATDLPYAGSYFSFVPVYRESPLAALTNITFKVYLSNGIGAYCGFPTSFPYNTAIVYRQNLDEMFSVTSNATGNVTTHLFDNVVGIGNGCINLESCNGNGGCDYCFERCHCFDGYGSSTDVVTVGRNLDGTCAESKFFVFFYFVLNFF